MQSRAIITANAKNKKSNDMEDNIFSIHNDLKEGKIAWEEAKKKLFILFNVVGQSEQYYCVADKIGAAGDCKSQCESCKKTGKGQ